ncbi:uncharacterized protein A4U43_C03F28710 [Asparagus officinalis]|uniref:Uncharacterized protein n=1 Tax=Asparagus officinalis TaxID=4686 RepID=A0A5P1FHX8_ASPOF|nr:uncharacterized protein A4U43_C03F28710 [Asparagus officinalis]
MEVEVSTGRGDLRHRGVEEGKIRGGRACKSTSRRSKASRRGSEASWRRSATLSRNRSAMQRRRRGQREGGVVEWQWSSVKWQWSSLWDARRGALSTGVEASIRSERVEEVEE